MGHIRRTFLTGLFAVIPVAITVYLIYLVDAYTRPIDEKIFGRHIPLVGALISLLAIYLVGVAVSHTMGKWALSRIDTWINRVPGLKQAYIAWKQVTTTADGGEGMWKSVALVESDGALMLGFTSGEPLPGAPNVLCVFVPAAPLPTQGRLMMVPRARCRVLGISNDEAFKFILSGGNYIPPELIAALGDGTRKLSVQSGTGVDVDLGEVAKLPVALGAQPGDATTRR